MLRLLPMPHPSKKTNLFIKVPGGREGVYLFITYACVCGIFIIGMHFDLRIARLWNALPLKLRRDLTSILMSAIKTKLSKFYKDRLINYFETENICTWVMACRCQLCR